MITLCWLAALVRIGVLLVTVPPGCLSLTPEATKFSFSQVTMTTITCSCDKDIYAVRIVPASADDNSTGSNRKVIVTHRRTKASVHFNDVQLQKYCVADATNLSLNLTCMDPTPDWQPFLRGRALPPDLNQKLAGRLFCECLATDKSHFSKPHLSWATAAAFECFAEFQNGANEAEIILKIPSASELTSSRVPSFRSSDFNITGKEVAVRKYVWTIDESITHPWREAMGRRLGLLVIVEVDNAEMIQQWKRKHSASCMLMDSVATTDIPCGNCEERKEAASVSSDQLYRAVAVAVVVTAAVAAAVGMILWLCLWRKAKASSRSYKNKAGQCESVQEESEFQDLHEPPLASSPEYLADVLR